jgi:hypothetical protein
VTETTRSAIATSVCSTLPSSRLRAGVARAQSAFRPAWYVASGAGFAKHTVMAGIDTNVWPLGLRELSSG